MAVTTGSYASDTVTFSYDALGRQTTSTSSAGPMSGATSSTRYDPAGNRISYDVIGAKPVAPTEAAAVVPIVGFAVIPIPRTLIAGQPATAPTGTSFAIAGPGVVQEGQIAVFTVTKSALGNTPIVIHYASSNGTAVADGDYDATVGSLSFQGWESIKTIAIPVKVDSVSEGSEGFYLNLSNASFGATISVASAAANIAANTVNIPPNAQSDTLSLGVCSSAEKNVIANDTDPDGNLPLTLISVSTGAPKVNAVVLDGTTVSVTAGGAAGTVSLTYQVTDSLGASAVGTLGVTVVEGAGCQ